MLMAEVMSKYTFTNTIHFVVFSGEEQGLYGSAHYVSVAKREGWKISAALVSDMISYSSKYFGLKIGKSSEVQRGALHSFNLLPLFFFVYLVLL
jgi:Zn-dependent M28 family amino/carboxypeptidase